MGFINRYSILAQKTDYKISMLIKASLHIFCFFMVKLPHVMVKNKNETQELWRDALVYYLTSSR